MTRMGEWTGLFDYAQAFSRSIGWITHMEQQALRDKRVAIAGLGGVGGFHLLTLVRLGVGRFNLAEFDQFELANFNRQAGASVSTLGRSKLEVMVAQALDINPELDIRRFPEGVTPANVDEFLKDCDLYVDGLDFFAFNARQLTFDACARLGLPATTVAPLGMGASLINFLPGRMTFQEYFGMAGHDDQERGLRFFVGLSPARLQASYLVDSSTVNLQQKRGPSTPMACYLCAGVMGSEALKILLNRGPIYCAPWVIHFDGYRNKLAKSFRPGGHRNWLQRLSLVVARRMIARMQAPQALITPSKPYDGLALRVLDRARWAPSGDNTQPWRFEVLSPDRFIVHGFDTRAHCVYDLDGHASQMSIGALLETMRIAASVLGVRADITRDPAKPEDQPTFHVRLTHDQAVNPSALAGAIEQRSVHRRPLSTRSIGAADKHFLSQHVGTGYELLWMENFADRLALTRILLMTAKLRLSTREAFEVHSAVFEWGRTFSETKIPDQAVGLDPLTLVLMRWAMQDWRRVRFMNRYLAGTLVPRLQLDLVPGMMCGAHVAVVASRPPAGMDDHLDAGAAMQRLWLAATCRGLQHQPAITPIIFSRYAWEGRQFSAQPESVRAAHAIADRMAQVFGTEVSRRIVWMGRLGYGTPSRARSLRLPLEQMITNGSHPLARP